MDLNPEPTQSWLDRYHYRGQRLPPIARQVLVSAPSQAFASIRRDGGIVAIGRVAVADGWGELTAVEVHPSHRRTGLATAITAALAAAAAAQGAASLYLQMAAGNQAARAVRMRRFHRASRLPLPGGSSRRLIPARPDHGRSASWTPQRQAGQR